MRIAIVIDALRKGGTERHALDVTLELMRAGHDVELIHYSDAGPKYDHPALHHAKVVFLPKKGKSPRFLWRLRQYLKHGGFDVVQVYLGEACIYGCLAGWLAGAPVVLGAFQNVYACRGLTRLCHRLVNRVATGWVVNARFIVDSMMASIGGRREKFFVIYNGVDPKAFESELTPDEAKRKVGLDADTQVVSIVGRLHAQKNHTLFLEMAKRVLARHPAARFLIVGEGELRASLEAHANDLGIADSVRFLGDRSDIPDLLAATDVFVLSSHHEGSPNALIEAMSVAVPVVSTDWVGVDEVVTDGHEGFVVPRDDAEAIAEKIGQFLGDADLRRRMGTHGKETAEKRFSLEVMTQNYISLYERCLAAVQ